MYRESDYSVQTSRLNFKTLIFRWPSYPRLRVTIKKAGKRLASDELIFTIVSRWKRWYRCTSRYSFRHVGFLKSHPDSSRISSYPRAQQAVLFPRINVVHWIPIDCEWNYNNSQNCNLSSYMYQEKATAKVISRRFFPKERDNVDWIITFDFYKFSEVS